LRLVIEPVANVNEVDHALVVIDGLDECSSGEGISVLITLLGKMLSERCHSFRFLFTSRPETYIESAFESFSASCTALCLSLAESKDDIRKYFRENLLEVRRKLKRFMQSEPLRWPTEPILEDLAMKSEGLFLYAATAVRYIGDGHGSPPSKKLHQVLESHNGVDPLYTQVITGARQPKHDICHFETIIGSLMYLRYQLSINELSELLGLEASEIQAALDGCRSILIIPEKNDDTIRSYHASLRDFLTKEERSKDLFCAPAQCNATLMIHCLKGITNALRNGNNAPKYASTSWCYHASSLLSESGQGLELLQSMSEAQVQHIDLKWMEFWIAEALCWGWLPYPRDNLPSSMVSWQHTVYMN
jgi:hypothetical protein